MDKGAARWVYFGGKGDFTFSCPLDMQENGLTHASSRLFPLLQGEVPTWAVSEGLVLFAKTGFSFKPSMPSSTSTDTCWEIHPQALLQCQS